MSPSSGASVAPKPQLVFSAEDEQVKHPAEIPDNVFAVLKQQVLKHWSVEDGGMPEKAWFSAERLRRPTAEADLYMVMAAGPLRGANVNEFWLVRYNTNAQESIILWSSPEHDVALRYRPGQPYPEIHTAAMSAVHIWEADFRFRDGKYILAHTHDEDIQ